MVSLPIDSLLPKVLETLQEKKNIILKASPGSGKTTRVPAALLQVLPSSESGKPREIWVLEPRKVAAKYSALRVAEELGEPIGERVGYQFKHEKKLSSKTQLRFITEGMLGRYLLNDPLLSKAKVIILDEFHERHLQTDSALSIVRFLQLNQRPDLQCVIMSATLETSSLERFLIDSVVLSLEQKPHPLEIDYWTFDDSSSLESKVQKAVQKEAFHSKGDLLVFLPGKREIIRCHKLLSSSSELRDFFILPLHGSLTKQEQDLAIRPQKKRKIILSTNLAESSLTIEGVDCVIDSGFERQSRFSTWTGIPSLVTQRISQASAEQRAGRAARTGPGKCVRLYSKQEFLSFVRFTPPEIMRSDLTSLILELTGAGIFSQESFQWFEAPSETALDAARNSLEKWGALEENPSRLSETGRKMARLPYPPRLSKLLVEGERLGILREVTELADRLSQGLPLPLDVSELWNQSQAKIKEALLLAFPDRIGQRRKNLKETELVLSAGGVVKAPHGAFTLSSDFFLILDVHEKKHSSLQNSVPQAQSLLALEESDLFYLPPHLLSENESLIWNPEKKKLSQVSTLLLGQLVLEHREGEIQDRPRALKRLIQELAGKSFDELSSWPEWVQSLSGFLEANQLESLLSRCLRVGEFLKVPISVSDFKAQLENFSWDEFSLSGFRKTPWESLIPEWLLKEKAHRLNELLPATLTLPSGRRAVIHYPLNQSPWIQSRIQDFFGMKETPRVLQGQLPLTLHLLAPNQRAIQVTQDLAGFWKNHYPEVRKELSRRYPRHSWPENAP